MELNRESFKLLSDDEIQNNIDARQELLPKMVGSLYPNIIIDEISLLKEIQNERTNTHSNSEDK